jgi:DNA mismatch endonuclease (patch repair protein)
MQQNHDRNQHALSAPTFRGLKPASPDSSLVKQRNRRQDTQHEILLRQSLWHMGLRFRKNVDTMLGKPDIVFSRARVVVFCDGDFWHGRDWRTRKAKLSGGTNAAYWVAKISSNMSRDARTTEALEQAGWRVIRLWEGDIKKDPGTAARCVFEVVNAQQVEH